ncbi:MAG TPA: DUF4339 domain-containing protein [Candidatus Brocadiia bacterium]|nr:DUF4339 domain-containing protein [Candidatus Brocadiia bacterium]
MDRIPVKCTACGKQFLVSAGLEGKKARCLCGSIVVVSRPSGESRQWYYAKDGKRHGPISEEDLRNIIANREIGMDAMVWTQGMEQWEPVEKHPDLIQPAASPQPSQEEAHSASQAGEPKEKEWYYAVADEQRGPVAASVLIQMLKKGEVSAATSVWSDGMSDWRKLREVEDLSREIPAGLEAAPTPEPENEPEEEEPAHESSSEFVPSADESIAEPESAPKTAVEKPVAPMGFEPEPARPTSKMASGAQPSPSTVSSPAVEHVIAPVTAPAATIPAAQAAPAARSHRPDAEVAEDALSTAALVGALGMVALVVFCIAGIALSGAAIKFPAGEAARGARLAAAVGLLVAMVGTGIIGYAICKGVAGILAVLAGPTDKSD